MEDDLGIKNGPIITISAPKDLAEKVRRIILDHDLFDPNRSIGRENTINFPVVLPAERDLEWLGTIFGPLLPVIEISTGEEGTRPRVPRLSPLGKIIQVLGDRLDRREIASLPERWEMIGDCLILKLHGTLEPQNRIIVETYQDVLGARYTLIDSPGIEGELRQPTFKIATEPPDGIWEVVRRSEQSLKQ